MCPDTTTARTCFRISIKYLTEHTYTFQQKGFDGTVVELYMYIYRWSLTNTRVPLPFIKYPQSQMSVYNFNHSSMAKSLYILLLSPMSPLISLLICTSPKGVISYMYLYALIYIYFTYQVNVHVVSNLVFIC